MTKILLVACEASADNHGGDLIKEIKKRNSRVSFSSVGSEEMKNAGSEIIFDAKSLSVMGLTEIIKKIPCFMKLFSLIIFHIKKNNIPLVILIDSPDFNLRLARKIKQNCPNTKVIYYVSPTIWAWRYNRVNTIRKYVNKMLVILPFEEALYKRENISVSFVGHPLLSEMKNNLPSAPKVFDPKKSHHIIAILPGSREFEIKLLADPIIDACNNIKNLFPSTRFLIPKASTISNEFLEKFFSASTIEISDKSAFELFKISDAAIIKSGTSILEAGLMGVPMVIIYKFSNISFLIAKHIIRLKKRLFGLVNIIFGREICLELFQQDVTGANISNELVKILSDKDYYNWMSRSLYCLKYHFSENKKNAADEVLNSL